jgi:hypothetical protein
MKKISLKNFDFKHSAYVAIICSTIIVFYDPLTVFYANHKEFSSNSLDILNDIFLIYISAFFILTVFLLLLPRLIFKQVSVVIVTFSLLCFFQAHVIDWSYGRLTGDNIKWAEFDYRGMIDSSVWIVALFGSVLFYKIIFRFIPIISVFIFVTSTATSVATIYSHQEVISKSYLSQEKIDDFYKLSKEKNIFLIILDGFGSDHFYDLMNRNHDAIQYFDGFEFYRNNTSNFGYTTESFPTLLTGKNFEKTTTFTKYLETVYEDSLVTTLEDNGIKTDLMPLHSRFCPEPKAKYKNCFDRSQHILKTNAVTIDTLALYDLTLFRIVPHFFKSKILNNYKWFFQSKISDLIQRQETIKHYKKLTPLFLDEFIVSKMVDEFEVVNKNINFKLLHLNLPHNPARYDKNCDKLKQEDNSGKAIREQSGCALKLASKLFSRLKQLKVYDQSLIFIISDHGHAFEAVFPNEFKHIDGAMKPAYRSSALLLAKRPFSKGKIKVNDYPVTLSDIPYTFASELKLKNNFPGMSIFEHDANLERERVFWLFHEKKRRTIPEIWEKLILKGHAWRGEDWFPSGEISLPLNLNIFSVLPPVEVINFTRTDDDKHLSLYGWKKSVAMNNGYELSDVGSVYFTSKQGYKNLNFFFKVGSSEKSNYNNSSIALFLNGKKYRDYEIPNKNSNNIFNGNLNILLDADNVDVGKVNVLTIQHKTSEYCETCSKPRIFLKKLIFTNIKEGS